MTHWPTVMCLSRSSPCLNAAYCRKARNSILQTILGGSWVVISRATSRITMVITPLFTTHEPPSNRPSRNFETGRPTATVCQAGSAVVDVLSVVAHTALLEILHTVLGRRGYRTALRHKAAMPQPLIHNPGHS